jgi:hypothetical protein
LAEGELLLGGIPGNVGSEVVAAAGEYVGLEVGNVSVEDYDGEETLAFVKDLHLERGRHLGHAAVECGAGAYGLAAEGHLDVHDRVEFGQEVRDNMELVDALHYDLVVHGTPPPVGEVPVDGLVHVTCVICVSSVLTRASFPEAYPCRPRSAA